ncbi:hypothetical protein CkaCkLH20_02380 [Colletotrichum karsti]|uniref:F-box domain-containing protein n=1 Tax=Colletotrichum karsti TaxID=1095194 RepID=A0A9P6LPH8_9PEZI|nr:uncharacterized protein CkaCkLH20_02380 [Colletotrichum karsti]KAF9880426.1 hypothetical protein CkaCkLH20_02380 [Colletotrichum karsti]
MDLASRALAAAVAAYNRVIHEAMHQPFPPMHTRRAEGQILTLPPELLRQVLEDFRSSEEVETLGKDWVLEQSFLASLCLVCKSFRSTAEQLLYRQVHLVDCPPCDPRFLSFLKTTICRPELRKMLRRANLEIDSDMDDEDNRVPTADVELIKTSAQELGITIRCVKRLHLSLPGQYDNADIQTNQHPGRKPLFFNFACPGSEEHGEIFFFPNLTHISISLSADPPSSGPPFDFADFEELSGIAPRLLKIHYDTGIFRTIEPINVVSLESLHLTNTNLLEGDAGKLMGSIRDLKKFHYAAGDRYLARAQSELVRPDELCTALERHCHSLEELSLDFWPDDDQPNMDQLLESLEKFKELKRLIVHYKDFAYSGMEDEFSSFITTLPRSLEAIYICGWGIALSETMNWLIRAVKQGDFESLATVTIGCPASEADPLVHFLQGALHALRETKLRINVAIHYNFCDGNHWAL